MMAFTKTSLYSKYAVHMEHTNTNLSEMPCCSVGSTREKEHIHKVPRMDFSTSSPRVTLRAEWWFKILQPYCSVPNGKSGAHKHTTETVSHILWEIWPIILLVWSLAAFLF